MHSYGATRMGQDPFVSTQRRPHRGCLAQVSKIETWPAATVAECNALLLTCVYDYDDTKNTYFGRHRHAVQLGQQHHTAAALADGLNQPQSTDVLLRVNPGKALFRNTTLYWSGQ